MKRNATGFDEDQGVVHPDEERTHAGDGGKQKLKKLEVAVEWHACGARIMSCRAEFPGLQGGGLVSFASATLKETSDERVA